MFFSFCNVFSNYPKHKICILSDRIGCENLYYSLATKYKFKIYPNACRRVLFEIKGVKNLFCYSKDEANILIPETLPPHKLETFTSAFNNQKYLNINVRLVATEREIKLIGNIKSGLVYVCTFSTTQLYFEKGIQLMITLI